MARNYRGYKKPKYNARKTVIDGITFDSSKEARRWVELRERQKNGEISELRRQVKFELVPAQREPATQGPRGGWRPGKLIEKEAAYYADFVYKVNATGEVVVEDVKGVRTDTYTLKRKIMLWRYGIRIREL